MDESVRRTVGDILRENGVSLNDHADAMKHATSPMDAPVFYVAAAAGVIDAALRAVSDVIGPPMERCFQQTVRFSAYIIDAIACAGAANNERALRALLQACSDQGVTLLPSSHDEMGPHTAHIWDTATSALYNLISDGPLNALILEFWDVLNVNTSSSSGGISMVRKLAQRTSSPTLVAFMRAIPPDMWTAGEWGLLPVVYRNEALLLEMLPYIPPAAFQRRGYYYQPVVCTPTSIAVAMSTFRAVWERSKEGMTPTDAAYLCGILLASQEGSMHLQLDLVLSSLPDVVRVEALRTRPDGVCAAYAGILAHVNYCTSPAALAVVLEHIMHVPQGLRLMSRTSLANFFDGAIGTHLRHNTEGVLRLLVEACTDERALGATNTVALVHNWYIGDGGRSDNIRSYMCHTSPAFFDYMLGRIPPDPAFSNERHCGWLRCAASAKMYDMARVLEGHLPRRAEVRQCMEDECPSYAKLIYPTLTKSANCA